jgi:DNA polymerase-3 subunit alpha
VVSAIIQTRDEGGKFTSPYDFVERVPSRLINRRVFDSLVLAGAFDWYPEIKREDYFEKNNRDESFSDQLLRYGQMYQEAKMDASASLFGDMAEEMNTAGRPEVKSAVPWVDAVRLEKERELVGMYLSAHPLDPYYMELNHGLSTIKEFLEMPIEEGREIQFGGMVTNYVERPTKKGGNFAVITLEDYTGSTEIRLFGQKYIDFSKYGREGTPIAVTMKVEKRFQNSELRQEVVRIQLLNDVKGQLIKGVTLSVTRDELKPSMASLLKEHMASNNPDASKGTLSFRIYDPDAKRFLRMTSKKRIPLDRKLENILESLPLIKYEFEKR